MEPTRNPELSGSGSIKDTSENNILAKCLFSLSVLIIPSWLQALILGLVNFLCSCEFEPVENKVKLFGKLI